MSANFDTRPIAWRWPLSLADEQRIEALDEDTRALVERYAQRPEPSPDKPEIETEYQRGWEDAMESARNELDCVYFAPAPRKRLAKLERVS